jgi:phosphoribosylformylglycinamidine synthase
MRFVDNHGQPTETYPLNPNGSRGGLTAVTTADGRFTAMMPHPERVFRTLQFSHYPIEVSESNAGFSPWMHLWTNARAWVN